MHLMKCQIAIYFVLIWILVGDLLSTPGAGGLQCHLEMNLLRLKDNLSSPPERGGEGEKVEAAGAGQVR